MNNKTGRYCRFSKQFNRQNDRDTVAGIVDWSEENSKIKDKKRSG